MPRRTKRSGVRRDIIGDSEAMRSVRDQVERLAATDVDVVIRGETGCGREHVARAIHEESRRAGGSFVPVDCAAIPEQLLDGEIADGGTLFLDEVVDLPVALQARLLHALRERRTRRKGGKEGVAAGARVLASTSRDLDAEVREHRFREDLHYYLHVVEIVLPPLRERVSDIPLLASHFLALYAEEVGRKGARIDAEALDILQRYPWPRNVRELENVVRRALLTCRSRLITPCDLPGGLVVQSGAARGAEVGFFAERARVVARFEREYLEKLLEKHGGCAVSAAEACGLPLGTLYRLAQKNGLRVKDFKAAEEGATMGEPPGSVRRSGGVAASPPHAVRVQPRSRTSRTTLARISSRISRTR